ncbi:MULTISPECIES: light-harvesting protein [unclassified Halorhodospira]|uniref:light-harvesting protein n=1 Tax=unclassified Halorhodospira TaxID=2626748 RepID=UPI001EE8BF82|nr:MULTISPECIES: light-harvesting protein [unclassified Halorhodospira]MCG5540525.1 light-harvesting protein [Halorhodospira sp. M39old]MCG5544979.1 light-harvesting protein [Halorhodospira sp. M38]
MNQARIWLVVKPSVGLPLLLGVVLLIALLVHGAILTNTDWYPSYFQGNAAAEIPASEIAESDALATRESMV